MIPTDLTTIFPTFLKYGSKLAGWPMRFYYTQQRLEKYLIFDISAVGDPINYQYSSQEARCWINAYNLSPFEFVVDRLSIEVVLDGGSFSCHNNGPVTIPGSSQQQLYIKGKSPVTPESFQNMKNSQRAWINIETYVETKIRSFRTQRQMNDVKNLRILG